MEELDHILPEQILITIREEAVVLERLVAQGYILIIQLVQEVMVLIYQVFLVQHKELEDGLEVVEEV